MKHLRILGIIPARFASTRFPGKPLAMIAGKTMIQRVYEQASMCTSLEKVVVATDDQRIADCVVSFGGHVILTSADHQSGTDRAAEALLKAGEFFDAAINIQGDEPFIHPQQIDLVSQTLQQPGVQIATLVKKIVSTNELLQPNSPKVVVASNGNALYFSRQAIPFLKDIPMDAWPDHFDYFKHIGIYGYSAEVLPKLTALPVGKLEKAESLEQLRWLENGFSIRTRLTDMETIAVDTPEDLLRAEALLQ